MAPGLSAARRASRVFRRFKRVPLAVVATIAALIGGYLVWPVVASSATPLPVFDVNHAGVFQMDGETHQQLATTPPSDNWEQLFTSSGALVSSPPSDLLAGAMFLDPAPASDFAFTTGGSKDISDTTSWRCAVTPVANKDELTFASAALFTAPSGTPLAGHEMFYMNLNRGVSTNGTSNAGFWLFQKPTQCNSATGTFTAPGTSTPQPHSNGDVFIFASFTIGGTAVTINTYHWENGALQLVGGAGASGGACYDTPTANLCGMDNSGLTLTSAQLGNPGGVNCTPTGCNGATTLPGAFTSPWGGALTNGFFEAGADLTAIEQAAGLPTVPCFASFEADTRSSGSSVSSQLKDFAGGAFNPCTVKTVTTPADSGGIVLGHSTSDSATVTQSPSGAPAPTGGVTFFACRIGPVGTAPAITGNCLDSSGVPLTTDTNLGTKALPASAPFTVTSDSFTPTQTGEYCFAGVYPGDSNYSTGSTDSSSGECFPVKKAPTQTKTTPSVTAPVVLGGSVSDSSTISPADPTVTIPPFPPIGGSVTYAVCGPLATTTTGGPNCAPGDVGYTPLGSATVTNGVGGASQTFTPHATGTYCFVGTYSGDSNYLGSSDSSSGECFTVTPAPTQTKTTPKPIGPIVLGGSVTDGATISPADPTVIIPPFPPIGGSITYAVCGPLPSTTPAGPNCTPSTVGYTTLGSATVTNGVGGASDSFTPHATGTYCFVGTYSGDSNYLGSSDSSSGECFTVTPAPTQTKTTPAPIGPVTLGGSVTDGATISPADPAVTIPPFPPIGGSITYAVCGPLPSTTPAGPNCTPSTVGYTTLGSATVTNGVGGASDSFTPHATGTYCFVGTYSGDGNYLGSSDSSSGECFTVKKAPTKTKTTPAPIGPIVLGGSVADSATISPADPAVTIPPFPPIGGSITYAVCGPLPSTTPAGPNCTPSTVGYTTLGSATVTNGVGGASNSFTPHATGTYCFVGAYSGDGNYLGSSDSSSGECFTVTPAPTKTKTTPSVTAPITLGASVSDSATISPADPSVTIPPFPPITGTVSYYVCGQFSAPGSGLCVDSAGNPLPSDIALGSGSVGGGGVAGPSQLFKPTVAGFYCFLGVYSGDSNYLGSSDNGSNECFQAKAVPPVLASTVALDDTVSIQKDATAGQPSGNVTFDLFGPFTSQDAVSCATTNVVSGSEQTIPAASETFDTSGNGYWTVNEDIPATGSGSVWYAWGASFTATNTNYLDGSLGCTAEEVNVNYGPGSGFSPPGNVHFS